ncbi:MAG: ABC transporter ATP-binding protein [Gammaproteobacteria bacterium]|jgi:tungstate transport system ATP-binding protein
MNSLHFHRIHQRFGRRTILDGVAISLCSGHCTLLTGDNGAGKTTLLRILGGFDRPEQFHVETGVGGLSWRRYRKLARSSVMYMHQQPYLFEGSVRDNLDYALDRKLPKLQRHERIREALEWGGLERIADSRANTLSGGECQRVALVRAWLRQPLYMLLDEPAANMDRDARLRTVSLLRRLRDEGMSLLIASHDPDYFSSLVNERQHLDAGRLKIIEELTGFGKVSSLRAGG